MNPVKEKADALLEEKLCDHCLGRQFAKLGYGLENYERGAIIRKEPDLEESDFDPENVPEEAEFEGSNIDSSECKVCGGLFARVDEYADMVISSFDRYELSTFLVGIRPPESVIAAEEDLWEDYGVEFTEPVKTELSRLIGKRVEKELGIEVDFERADIMAVVDMREGKERIELQVNSLLVYGQYNKYSRELPQTEWHCRNCRGDGCDECDWTGKNYPTSVQEIIQEPFMRETKAIDAKFHGGGREDVDAKCLGKREFVLELREPIHRDLDLEALAEEVNESEDVEIFNVRPAGKDEAAEIKQKHADKRYRALVELEEDIEEESLEKLQEIVGEVKQFTPNRVQHRRAEKVRKREVFEIEAERVGEKKIELEIEAEAGTYIKELISSDEGNTEPSVSDILGTKAECVELDVLWVEK
ncbi:tRNA pseudouridine(54/55) synthase Pus10 [Candidatus Nanohalococcus occultus]|uniref:tRNA pseudouridine synthase Pus10 n=1 Tax=Candidatus Nanohalococcus occultus TaxID=2978047 RepID=A0ABY8CDX6_9ARCH|nr:tRNA U54 and U55 pseudouridine synthase Pus10 [Candidatus Nanohaloarchaeota archaeon SVXNc]